MFAVRQASKKKTPKKKSSLRRSTFIKHRSQLSPVAVPWTIGLFDTSGMVYGTPGTYPWRAKLIAPRADPLCDAKKQKAFGAGDLPSAISAAQLSRLPAAVPWTNRLYHTSGTFYRTPGTYPWRAKLIAPRAGPLCDAEKGAEKERAKKKEQGQN